MGPFLIAAIGLQYLAVAADQYWKGDPAHALMYFAYALANVGLWFAAR
jgi:hypothetical protein